MRQDEIEQLLDQTDKYAQLKRFSLWLGLLVLVAFAAVWRLHDAEDQPQYLTSLAKRGDLTVTVTATGELKPRIQVEVGTEVSGTIQTVLADYNDRVRRGQELARLDTAQLEARKRQTEAALALAKARLREAQATLKEAENKFRRAKRLIQSKLISEEEYEVAEAAFLRAQAALDSAQAQVTQIQAQLDENLRILEKAVIRAPIEGIVLKRQVEPGQTVAASLQTPVLFILAETLSQMELHVAVDEADVGQIREGQTATFTVDAYPERRFQAILTQVRYAPQVVDGVVTYEAILAVDNSDLALRPGMTATAEILVNRVQNALLVPNAALRFTPPSTEKAKNESGSILSRLFPRPRITRKAANTQDAHAREQRVWTLRDSRLIPVAVTTGASDGAFTQITGGELKPGTPLVVDIAAKAQ